MSTPRFKWWSYVQWMIRLYPERVTALRQLQEAALCHRLDLAGGARSSDVARPTEDLAISSLGATCDREVEAVRRAILAARGWRNGDLVLKLIDLEFWRRTHTLSGAAVACYISEPTAQRLRSAFIQEVAYNFDLMDYTEDARKIKLMPHAAVSL